MSGLLHDLRYSVRTMLRAPGFTLIAVLTLALGIGANVAVFSIADEVWLRPRPVPHPDRVLRLFTSNPSSEGDVARGLTSYADYLDVAQRTKTLAGVALLDRRGAMLQTGGVDKLVSAAVVSPNFFALLQPTPARGRIFSAPEGSETSAAVVMISYPFWQQQFNADPNLAGHTIVVDHREVVVAGVLPRGFRGSAASQVPDIWIPIATWTNLTGDRFRPSRSARNYDVFARLRPEYSLEQANAEVSAIAAGLAREFPATNLGRQMSVTPENDVEDAGTKRFSLMLLAISALVLLIACANVAGLMLARGEHRREELATRVALGATPMRLLRQMITETAVLGALAGGAALLLGSLIIDALPKLLPHASISSAVDAHLDARALLFAAGAALVSVLVAGLIPAWQASRSAPGSAMKQHGVAVRSGHALARTALVTAEVAVSLVLVVGAGLVTRSLLRVNSADPGFDAHQNMLVLELAPSPHYEHNVRQFVDEARRRLEQLPGVKGTAVALRVPFGLSGGGATRKVFLPNATGAAASEGIPIHIDPVSDRYFEVMGTRLLRGRTINASDYQTGARVLVISQAMAQRFWPQGDPVGRQIRLERPDGAAYEVIGVAEDAKNEAFGEDPLPYMYTPWPGDGEFAMAVTTAVDASGLANDVRRTLREVDRDLEIVYLASLREHMRQATTEQRTVAGLTIALGNLGLLLAGVGLYGLTAFLVGRRTQEIGIRMALGAQRRTVFQLVVGRSVVLTAAGIAVGMAAAFPATGALRSFLFNIEEHDPLTFTLAAALLVIVACVAAFIPALRATRVHPLEALRHE